MPMQISRKPKMRVIASMPPSPEKPDHGAGRTQDEKGKDQRERHAVGLVQIETLPWALGSRHS
jgi:hypothetical protein